MTKQELEKINNFLTQLLADNTSMKPAKEYKNYDIGKSWCWDPIEEQERNPICYYIPVGDGLYRPTMDIRIFAEAACSAIDGIDEDKFSLQAHCLVDAGYQYFDICLATKLRLKDFLILFNAENEHIPPYITQKWKTVFGSHCSWHPVHKRKEQQIQENNLKLFPVISQPNDPFATKLQFKSDTVNRRTNRNPLIPKTNEWLLERGFTKNTSGVLYSVTREYTIERVDWSNNQFKPYLFCHTKPKIQGRASYSVNQSNMKKWFSYAIKTWHDNKPFTAEEFLNLVDNIEMPRSVLANVLCLSTVSNSSHEITDTAIKGLNKFFGFECIIQPVSVDRHTHKKPTQDQKINEKASENQKDVKTYKQRSTLPKPSNEDLKSFLNKFDEGFFTSVFTFINTITTHFNCTKGYVTSRFKISNQMLYNKVRYGEGNITRNVAKRINEFVGKKIAR